MTSRGQAAVVQLAVFVGGGILGPVWHLAHHRNDHTHGGDGREIAFDLGVADEPDHGHAHAHDFEVPAEPEAEAHTHPLAHPHRHLHAHASTPAPTPPSDRRYAATHLTAVSQVLNRALRGAGHDSSSDPPDHGHGSIAHFGLALLGAPPLLRVPAPEPGEWVSSVARTAALSLFHPAFPLPRPPPPARSV